MFRVVEVLVDGESDRELECTEVCGSVRSRDWRRSDGEVCDLLNLMVSRLGDLTGSLIRRSDLESVGANEEG